MQIIHQLAALILKPYVKRLSNKALPQLDGKLEIDRLNKNASLIRDKWGVPHLYAEDKADIFFIQGFTHAQDRFFQMEMLRRIASGRLCELFGEETLATDRFSRSLAFKQNAEKDLQRQDEEVLQYLNAYTEGVNYFLEQFKENLPAECKLLKIKPEKWTPIDSLAIARMISWQMGFVWFGKLVRSQLESKFGEKGKFLDLLYEKDNPHKLEKDIEFNIFETSRELKKATGPWLQNVKGSNGWAVSGKKTDTGFPYLCNDTHLASLQPSIWYENHLIAPGYHATGVSIPGMPLVMVGHNQHIAWGITLGFTEIQDILFLDKADFDKKSFTDRSGKNFSIDEREEVFQVKGKKKPLKENFYQTDFGPVMHTLNKSSKLMTIMHSPAMGEHKMISGFKKLNFAENWDDFVNAVDLIDATAMNIVYADVYGNTGYYLSGKTPKRHAEDGSFPLPVKAATLDKAYLSVSEKPHAFNPEKGYLISSNHKIVTDDYPYYLGKSWMDGFRAKRLNDLMAEKDKFSMADMQRFQSDQTCLAGVKIKDALKQILKDEDLTSKPYELFFNWDGNAAESSTAMSVYSVWKDIFLKKSVGAVLDEESFKAFRGTGPDEVLTPLTEFYGQEATQILKLFRQPEQFFEGGASELKTLILESFEETFTYLKEKLGNQADEWSWGKLHSLTFMHAFGKKPPFDRIFNQGPFSYGGDADTPCQAAWHPEKQYNGSLIFPAVRFIFDTSDWERSVSVVPPGQSERPGSPFYNNQLETFLSFKYKPVLWEKDSVIKHSKHRLDFTAVEK